MSSEIEEKKSFSLECGEYGVKQELFVSAPQFNLPFCPLLQEFSPVNFLLTNHLFRACLPGNPTCDSLQVTGSSKNTDREV